VSDPSANAPGIPVAREGSGHGSQNWTIPSPPASTLWFEEARSALRRQRSVMRLGTCRIQERQPIRTVDRGYIHHLILEKEASCELARRSDGTSSASSNATREGAAV
jgi:hypothetical protein